MKNVRRRQVSESRKKKRLIYVTCGIMIFIYLTLTMITGDNGLMKYMKLLAVNDQLRMETQSLQHQNEDTRKQIDALRNDPALVEELAREYGLARDDELIFKFKDEE